MESVMHYKRNQNFCTLEPVPFETVWEKEVDFTFDLANDPALLRLLGEELGFDLGLIATEQAVGSYRADIICKDRNTLETSS